MSYCHDHLLALRSSNGSLQGVREMCLEEAENVSMHACTIFILSWELSKMLSSCKLSMHPSSGRSSSNGKME